MSRSSWKPLFLHSDFVIQQQKNKEIILYNRSSVITKQMLGLKLHIYNGLRFFPLNISTDMIGHRLGEFAPTRKKPVAKIKDKKK